MLDLCPISQKEAFAFNEAHHRHHAVSPRGWLWGHGLMDDTGRVVGCAIVGRPISKALDEGWTCEVTRLCTLGDFNGCSMLYSASWRAARAFAYRRILTYILESEDGASLKAAGWKYLWTTRGGSWDRPGRPRTNPNQQTEPKQAWGCGAWRQLAAAEAA